jgi:hypothetical protein
MHKIFILDPLCPPLIDWKSTGAIGKKTMESEKFPERRLDGVPAGHCTVEWPWAFSRASVLVLAVTSARPDPRSDPNQIHTMHQRSTNQERPQLHRNIRLLPHIGLFPNGRPAPLPSLSLSPIPLSCPEVNMIPDPYTLLFLNEI